MKRQIFVVDARIVDANGALHTLDGYPKAFDSQNYQNDIDKARRRAEGDLSETWGAMCKRDDRQMQMVKLTTADGFELETRRTGQLADLPDPAITWTDPSLELAQDGEAVIATRGGTATHNYGAAVSYHLYENGENIGTFDADTDTMRLTPAAGIHTYALVASAGNVYDEGASATIAVTEAEE